MVINNLSLHSDLAKPGYGFSKARLHLLRIRSYTLVSDLHFYSMFDGKSPASFSLPTQFTQTNRTQKYSLIFLQETK
jgi:hypothetical protein